MQWQIRGEFPQRARCRRVTARALLVDSECEHSAVGRARTLSVDRRRRIARRERALSTAMARALPFDDLLEHRVTCVIAALRHRAVQCINVHDRSMYHPRRGNHPSSNHPQSAPKAMLFVQNQKSVSWRLPLSSLFLLSFFSLPHVAQLQHSRARGLSRVEGSCRGLVSRARRLLALGLTVRIQRPDAAATTVRAAAQW